MFRKNRSPIGLEIGEAFLRMVQLEKFGGGWKIAHQVRVERSFDEEEKEEGGLIPAGVLREALKKGGFSGKDVVSSMPQELLDILPLKLSLVKEESLEDAVVREAKSFLSYDLNQAVLDYLVVREESFGTERRRNLKVLLIAAKRADVEAHLSLLKQCGLRPVAIEIPACALARIFRMADEPAGRNSLIVNLKEQSTSLTVLCNGRVLLDRNIAWGSDMLQSRLSDQLQLDPRKAMDLLKRTGVAACRLDGKDDGEVRGCESDHSAETVCEIITPELEILAEEMEKVFLYFSAEMRGDQIDNLCLTGLSGSIRALDLYLQQRIGLPAAVMDLGVVIGLGNEAEEAEKAKGGEGFGVALGLALRGFDVAAIQTERVEENVSL